MWDRIVLHWPPLPQTQDGFFLPFFSTEKRRVHPYTEKQLRQVCITPSAPRCQPPQAHFTYITQPEQDTSCLISLPHLPPSPLLLLFQSKQSIGQTLKGLEDLDILVEVLQEDLNKSQLKKESLRAAPDGFWQGFPAELQAPWWGAGGSKQAAGSVQERCQSFTKLRSHCCFTDCSSALQEEVESSFCDGQKDMHEPDSPGTFSRTREKESSWWMQGVGSSTQKHCWAQPAQSTSPCFDPPGAHPEPFVEADSDSLGSRGCSRQTSIAFTQQDLSAISFFQFQLHREESLLRNIPADKLLAPDENGNRSPAFFPIEIH